MSTDNNPDGPLHDLPGSHPLRPQATAAATVKQSHAIDSTPIEVYGTELDSPDAAAGAEHPAIPENPLGLPGQLDPAISLEFAPDSEPQDVSPHLQHDQAPNITEHDDALVSTTHAAEEDSEESLAFKAVDGSVGHDEMEALNHVEPIAPAPSPSDRPTDVLAVATETSAPPPTSDVIIPPPLAPSPRLVSLDALRGFDMFWIVGGDGLVHALAKLWPIAPLFFLSKQFQHKDWAGFAAEDLIFPMFVFVVGVSLVFSLSKRLQTHGKAAAIRHVILRGVILYVLGLLYYDGIANGFHQLRLMGVLQRIALAYLFTGLFFCLFRGRTLLAICVLLLVGYWALLSFVHVPGIGHASFEEGKNLTNWIDSRYLPLRKWDGNHDPEGLLSTLPAIASCLLGVFAGLLLKCQRPPAVVKALILLLLGAGGVALGFYWGGQWPWPHGHVPAPYVFPVIKKLWTSSFVLVAAGFSAALLGLFYLILDVCKFQKWAAPFVWIGANAITLYMLEKFLNYDRLARCFVGEGYAKPLTNRIVDVAAGVIGVGIMLGIARFLYKRRVFIRV